MSDSKSDPRMWFKDGIEALKLFNAFKKEHPNLVFYMSRTCDEKVYGYFSTRVNDKLMAGSEVHCASIMVPEWQTKTAVPALIHDSFFALTVVPIPNTKKYSAKLAGFPDRTMTISLKQDTSPGKNDGLVTSTSTLYVAGVPIADVRIFCMHKQMTFNALDIPDVQKIVVFGTVAKSAVADQALAAQLYPLSESQFLVWEEFPITQELLNRFNITELTKKFVFGK